MNRKKDKRKQKEAPTITEKFKAGWMQKRPVLFFVLGFCVLMILFYTFWLSDFFELNIHPKIVSANASISSFFLNLLGQQTLASNQVVVSPRFSISVSRGCDAIEAMALFGAAMLAFPFKWTKKLTGLFIGIIVLFVLNLVRIISLFLTGVYAPRAFEIMHVEVWQVVFIFIALALWIFWIRMSLKQKTHAQS